MRVTFFSARRYDREAFEAANRGGRHTLVFLDARLEPRTAALAREADAVCLFVNDDGGAAALEALAEGEARVVALRSAGFNHVDLEAAERLGFTVVRVPAYSPHAVAEHTLALVLSLVRHIPRAHARVRELNFSLDGLMGFDLAGRTVGVVGTGRIGSLFARMMLGIGCQVVAHDRVADLGLLSEGVRYLGLDALLAESDIVSLHVPLVPETHHLIDADALATLRPGALLVNTSRGPLVDTRAVIQALKSGHLGALALDVYEEEEGLFFRDLSDEVIADDVFTRLLTFPNVLITAHQAFFTREAVTAIAETTLANLDDLEAGRPCDNQVRAQEHLAGKV